MKLSKIKEIVKAEESTNYFEEREILNILFDSRKIINPESSVFIAIKGNYRDGHSFIKDAYDKGVRSFIVSEEIKDKEFPKASFLKVKNTLPALHQIAIFKRKNNPIPVIGITGSNGKTIIKEWLFQLLAQHYNILRSPKSFNSQIGVPLSVWKLEGHHNLGIFEAGISQPGEMELLEKIIQPDIGVFTNIGDAHSEGFLHDRQKIREKLQLFTHAHTLVYCKDVSILNETIVDYRNSISQEGQQRLNLFTWSRKLEATLQITSIEKKVKSTIIIAIFEKRKIQISIPFQDYASIENAIHCWCVLLFLRINDQEIESRMSSLTPVEMRLELLHGMNNCTLINDTYNSDLVSLQIALDFLAQQKQHLKKTIILSDLMQMSRSDSEIYEDVAAWINQGNIQRVIGIGNSISRHKSFFEKYPGTQNLFYKTTEEFLKNIHLLSFENEAILLKGARVFKFEKIEKLLEQKIHKTILEINLSLLLHNLKVYRGLISPKTKIMVMVKAFSYGSGSFEIANLLQYAGVNYLAVAYVDEGVALRKAGITMPIMVMSPESDAFDRMISWNLEPEIFSLDSLKQFIDIADTLDVEDYPIHIKLDTGMHRLGFMEHELGDLKILIKHNKHLKIKSIFSHLSGSEDESLDDFTNLQTGLLKKMSEEIQELFSYKIDRHILNSAGIVKHPEFQFEMVRLGLGLYGLDSSNKIQSKLKTVSTLKTTIAQIKTIDKNETVGYNRKGVLKRNSVIATVNIGYADGYFRDFGNEKGFMLVNGQKAKVLGSVCMDMSMIDITDMENIKVGDEVIVFGEELSLNLLAKWANTIPYEIMTSISQRVNRIYLNE